MKLTIEISENDLRRIKDEYGGLYFVLPLAENSQARKIKALSPWSGYVINYGSSEREKWEEKRAEEQKQITNSAIKDIEVEYPYVQQTKFKVIKIEPNEERKW